MTAEKILTKLKEEIKVKGGLPLEALAKGGDETMKTLHKVAVLLLIVGGLNWGLVGLFNYNLVMALFGGYPAVEMLIYVLVGLSAVYVAFTHKGDCKVCSSKK